MEIKFTRSYEDLKNILSPIEKDGEWIDLNVNQKQFRYKNDGILNWFPSTGTINFQGKEAMKKNLEQLAIELIQKSSLVEIPISEISKIEIHEVKREPEKKSELTEIEADEFLGHKFCDSELVIGLVGAVGTDMKPVISVLLNRLKTFEYETQIIYVSKEVIPQIIKVDSTDENNEYKRISSLMDAGNKARELSKNNSILALGAAAIINSDRPDNPDDPPYKKRTAYIISSLKHPDEVSILKQIYSEGFFLLGVHSDEKRRVDYLTDEKRIEQEKASELMERDADEHLPNGQRTSDTFHLSDFFIRLDENHDKMRNSIWRVLDLIFGDPYTTPTFDEYAMFMAFSASLRSSDLSRQVGAIIAKNGEIIATGANDCPKFGGGLYWPTFSDTTFSIEDFKAGRDYMRGQDSNKIEKDRIIEDIVNRLGEKIKREEIINALEKSKIQDITEYGRVVHAEMEALLSCARNNISSVGATLYGTTFPCHNCAKHIIAAGIKRVVYVEPYPKSKAAEFHSDAISLGFTDSENTVSFEPFVGVGPRRFFDLFSMRLGSGYPLKRKDDNGFILKREPKLSKLRIQMLPCSYIDREILAAYLFNDFRKEIKK